MRIGSIRVIIAGIEGRVLASIIFPVGEGEGKPERVIRKQMLRGGVVEVPEVVGLMMIFS